MARKISLWERQDINELVDPFIPNEEDDIDRALNAVFEFWEEFPYLEQDSDRHKELIDGSIAVALLNIHNHPNSSLIAETITKTAVILSLEQEGFKTLNEFVVYLMDNPDMDIIEASKAVGMNSITDIITYPEYFKLGRVMTVGVVNI